MSYFNRKLPAQEESTIPYEEIVEFDDGNKFGSGCSIMEAYQAMEYIYNIMRNAQADSNF